MLLEKIGAKDHPFDVPIVSENDAKIDSCFYNVERKKARHGGSTCYGWG